MLRYLLIGGLAIALFSASVLAPIVSKGGIELVLADGFSSNGDKIGAWYWLRRKGHRAKWEFKVDLNRVKDPYIWINFEVLVADTYDGGPGWNASPRILIYVNGRYLLMRGEVFLYNPARPTLPGPKYYSKGWGYKAFGAVPISIYKLKEYRPVKTITVILEWAGRPGPGSTPGHTNWQHVAVNGKACYLAYKAIP